MYNAEHYADYYDEDNFNALSKMSISDINYFTNLISNGYKITTFDVNTVLYHYCEDYTGDDRYYSEVDNVTIILENGKEKVRFDIDNDGTTVKSK